MCSSTSSAILTKLGDEVDNPFVVALGCRREEFGVDDVGLVCAVEPSNVAMRRSMERTVHLEGRWQIDAAESSKSRDGRLVVEERPTQTGAARDEHPRGHDVVRTAWVHMRGVCVGVSSREIRRDCCKLSYIC